MSAHVDEFEYGTTDPVTVRGEHAAWDDSRPGVWQVTLTFCGDPDIRTVRAALLLAVATVEREGLAHLSWDELAEMLPKPQREKETS